MSKRPIRALLVDDEALARANLKALISHLEGWQVAGEAHNGSEAIRAIERLRPDVIFLDIRMPGLNGMQVARSLGQGLATPASLPPDGTRPSEPLVVFATAFTEHALEAFEVEATDYLIKPIDRERFLETVGRLQRRIEQRRHAEARKQAGETLDSAAQDAEASQTSAAASESSTKVLAVKSIGRVRLVKVSEIKWIGSAGNYVRLYLGERCFLHRATLSSLERELDPQVFLRIHRSTMVNRLEVAELQTSVHGRYQLRLRDGTELEVSQRFKPKVYAELMPR